MKVTDEWLYEKMPIVDAAMVRQLEVGSSTCDACGSTHRHDECGGLPGTVFSYGKNGAGW